MDQRVIASAHCAGNVEFKDPQLSAIARAEGQQSAWCRGYELYGRDVANRVVGRFSVSIVYRDGHAFAATDRFGTYPLCYSVDQRALHIGERANDVGGDNPELDPQGIFDYLYFHVIPAPRTAFKAVYRLAPGSFVIFKDGELTVDHYWTPTFAEDRHQPIDELRQQFRALLQEAVSREVGSERLACFLSGGTDSSTIAGILRSITGEPVQAFSIGFDAQGYDEMHYARVAASHFKLQHHEYYLTPDDLIQSVANIAGSYDQPFGNSSVVPAYFCARMAREHGIQKLLAGDGGDEVFGGNTRYAKQCVFSYYERLPTSVRQRLIEPALLSNPIAAHVPGMSKAASYVRQARLTMPDRMETYNLLQKIGTHEVLTDEFLAQVDEGEPRRLQRETYALAKGASLVNRMLAYDWKYTLADCDIPKVVGAASLAGISVGFPLLYDPLVDFSLDLLPELKVKRLALRWFFKDALRGFLPDEIISKKKHGFGLPFGVWLMQNDGLKALASDSLALLRGRGIVRDDFLSKLIRDHVPAHPAYYGEMVWILMMLAHWLSAQHPRTRSAAVATEQRR